MKFRSSQRSPEKQGIPRGDDRVFQAAKGRVALKHFLKQAQAGAGRGDGELGVEGDDYEVSHSVRLDLHQTKWHPQRKSC
jgi:hypothetical protein